MSEEKVEPRIVEAVAVAASRNNAGAEQLGLAKEIEDAMSAAIAECYKNSIYDPEIVKAKMLEARQLAKARHLKAIYAKVTP